MRMQHIIIHVTPAYRYDIDNPFSCHRMAAAEYMSIATHADSRSITR